MATLAERTRAAVDDRPFLRLALAAGVLNYAAAARFLDVEGEQEAVATALRRYGETLSFAETDASTPVRFESGLGVVEDGSDALLAVNGVGFGPGEGSLTGVVAAGATDPGALATVLGRLDVDDVAVEAAGVSSGGLVLVVERAAGANAVRAVEAALTAVPSTSE